MLYVGQRVVYVDDRRKNLITHPHETLPKLGSVYTVRDIIPCRALYGDDEDGLYLVEIVNPVRIKYELAFRVSRFRPVQTTNIDVFLRMLKPTRVVEVA
jgi:hypothetical protein